MTELTVSMPAYNTGKYIDEAIKSVLKQKGVDFEIIVVDDGSSDNTAEIVKSCNDPRIRVLINEKNMGISYCRNLVIQQSRSPFIAHVDSDDIVFSDTAFLKMVNALKKSPDTGQSHCYYFIIDEYARLTRNTFRTQWQSLLKRIKPNMDYKKELLVQGSIMNHLCTYRREIFDVLGMFDENLRHGGEEYDMALRIIDKFEIKLVPEFLYCVRRRQGNTSSFLDYDTLIRRFQKWTIVKRLLKGRKVIFLNQKKYNANKLMLLGFYLFLIKPCLIKFTKKIESFVEKIREFMMQRILLPVFDDIYLILLRLFSWWPIDLFRVKINKKKAYQNKHIAYYLWQFPVLSETFIQREILALRKNGVFIDIIADCKDEKRYFDENAKELTKDATYLLPINTRNARKYFMYFFIRRHIFIINLLFYVIFHKYGQKKNFIEDIKIITKSVYLAGLVKDKQIDHIHSPWADKSAFVALIASKILGIQYSVQARAFDIYRKTSAFALREKFENAKYVITNTKYNEVYIKSILSKKHWRKINVIYNGIDLGHFSFERRSRDDIDKINILTIARITGQKGLDYLIKACSLLKKNKILFNCDIIGAPEEPLYTNYYIELKKLHKELRLEDSVYFLGAMPFEKTLERLKKADIFVLPCIVEENGDRDVTPNALIEAMAMSLPVVSTNITGIPEIVDGGINGILVQPKNEHALMQAIIKLIKNQDLRKKLGEDARKKIEQRFDISNNIKSYVELFKGL